jgi:DNA repair protein RecN (Recombination protein N)
MLKRLHIRNYALIDEIDIHFSERLTIITGETGAGKSILLGALGLVMGERADSKVFYNDSEKCVVEATFDVSSYDLKSFFDEHELDYDSEVFIRREVSPAGKSRAFVNDTPVNNQVLQRLTEALVDLHQQFDTLDIHNVNFQLRMIDALADNAALLKEYQSGYRRYASDRKKLAEYISLSESGSKEMDFLRFQLEELQQAALTAGEQDAMENELAKLTGAEEIKMAYAAAFSHLVEGEQNVISQLQSIARSFQHTRKLSADLSSLSERFDALIVDLQDIGRICDRIAEKTEHDPERIMELQDRLNIIYKLQKKHGVSSVEELLEIQARLEDQTSGYTDLGEVIAKLEKEISAQDAVLREKAAVLSTRRKSVTAGFETRVHGMLEQLSMPHARLKVEINDTAQLSATGLDDVQFLFASNVGSRFLPIRDVASGGELSRLTLCTKSLVADAIPLPTLIFDEIDTGISGDVSLKMGHILKELSERHQVVSITHTRKSPRVQTHTTLFTKRWTETGLLHVSGC